MAPSAPPATGGDAPEFPTQALIRELESIPEPALIILPDGRIAAVNRIAVRLGGIDPAGLTVGEFVRRFGARRADGRPLSPGAFPYACALRGERVDRGELFDGVLPDGTVYHARSSSTPIVVDGKVVAALSIWHNFPEELRRLVERLKRPGAESAIRPE